MNDNLEKVTLKLQPFKKICMTLGELPASYVETMSYYEMLVWFVHYLRDEVIPVVNANSEATEELQVLFNELQSYVANYFEDLDIQDEINNKLDEMAVSGELTDIIAQYLGLAGLITFDNVADMKLAQNLVNGSKCCTLGYYEVNDGGNAFYKVRTITNDDVVDDKFIIELYDDSLIAELITTDLNIKQLGAYGDNTHDDTSCFIAFANSNVKKIKIPYGDYIINDILTFENKELFGIGKPILKISAQSTSREHFLVFSGNAIVKNIIFSQGIDTTKTIGLINCSNGLFENCKTILETNHVCGSELDIYTNNQNITFKNCIFDFKSYKNNTNGTGGIWIREYDATKTSKNITFENCYISHYSTDECLAVWSWNGNLENVQINNCILEGKENNPSSHFTRFSATNSSMNNCILINKPNVEKSSIIHNSSVNDHEIVYINNCLFDLNITLLSGVADNYRIKLNNCTINNSQLTRLQDCWIQDTIVNSPGFLLSNATMKNCTINVTNNYSFTSSGSIRYGCDLENCTFNNLAYSSIDNIIKSDSDNLTYRIINCSFNGDFTGLTRLMSSTKICKIYIVNSILPVASFNLSSESNTGYLSNNLVGTSLGYPTGLKTNNNFNYNS